MAVSGVSGGHIPVSGEQVGAPKGVQRGSRVRTAIPREGWPYLRSGDTVTRGNPLGDTGVRVPHLREHDVLGIRVATATSATVPWA